jgi:hypothetical protein
VQRILHEDQNHIQPIQALTPPWELCNRDVMPMASRKLLRKNIFVAIILFVDKTGYTIEDTRVVISYKVHV